MAEGKTHDAITLWTCPLLVGGLWLLSGRSDWALLLGSSYIFSGLMFSGDLDIHSNQYRRWGWLRGIWLPYRRLLAHRSFWSHGPIAGTLGRLVYVTLWLSIVTGLITVALSLLKIHWLVPNMQPFLHHALLPSYALSILAGLELGSISHSLGDVLSTGYKRLVKRWKGS